MKSGFSNIPSGPKGGKPKPPTAVKPKSTIQDTDPSKKPVLKDWSGISDMDSGFQEQGSGPANIDGDQMGKKKAAKKMPKGFYGR